MSDRRAAEAGGTTPGGRVSVAMCTFNGAQFVEAQFESIVREGAGLVCEIVVADDGSADDTLERVRRTAVRLGVQDSLVVLEGGGHGVTANFERAMRACAGELIALSDQDDVWLPGRLEAQVAALDASPDALLVFADAELIDAEGRPLDARLLDRLEVGADDRRRLVAGDAFDLLLRRNVVTGATVLVRRELLERALPFPSSWVHDEWLAAIAAVDDGVRLIERPVTAYRQHGGNEIGVKEPTFRRKVQRMTQPRADRNRRLSARADDYAARLDALGGGQARRDAARRKADFERFRADLPASRIARAIPVLRRASSGAYGRYASQGNLDVVRDLVQPAR
ncbi:glycosyltransferase family 2 protein [Agromyces sp. MMS24-JH15]|uniref:glycosyltransferase family 2 protein n=1 Tax=Agromyces sp. MMS24-JH15 TaxID=3243765 RepID=UPI003748B942